jgi:parallel beta-helix repeat protein
MPQIDRALEGPRNLFKDKLLATLIASAVVVSFVTMVLAPAINDTSARITYTNHAPILINDSADFAVQAALPGNNWAGDGTQGNPYVIQNYSIDASSNEGIAILDTNAYFIIRGCWVYLGNMGMGAFDGIYLYNCTNGTLIDNALTDNGRGIRLVSSSNNTLSNNSCTANDIEGILLSADSNDNILSDNNCSNNVDAGIRVTDSSGSTVSNNTCLGNFDGIDFLRSSGNTVFNNTVGDNVNADSCGIWLLQSTDNTIVNNTCSNTCYGLALTESSNNSISNNSCYLNDEDGIFFYSSDNNTLRGNTCSNNTNSGLTLDFSCDNNTFLNNTFSGNAYNGISIYTSSNNTFSDNNLSGNIQYGLYIWDSASSNNIIWNNTFIHNNGTGDAYNPTHIQAYDNGTSNRWNSTSTYGNWWSDWRAPDADVNGIVDNPYNISGSIGAKDLYPRTDAQFIPEFSDITIPAVGLMLIIVLMLGRTRNRP